MVRRKNSYHFGDIFLFPFLLFQPGQIGSYLFYQTANNFLQINLRSSLSMPRQEPNSLECNDQGRIFGTEIVFSTPNARFNFFFNPKKHRNIVLEWNYVIWSRILAKFSAKCRSLVMTSGLKNESSSLQ